MSVRDILLSAGSGISDDRVPFTLYTWGSNSSGQLGFGTADYTSPVTVTTNRMTPKSSPTQVGTLTNWSTVSAGNLFSAAIKTDGTLWSWGSNDNGNLGLGDRVDRSSPAQVGTDTDWKQVACSKEFFAYGGTMLAIKTNGTLWGWGYGFYGSLGNNLSNARRSAPMQIGTDSNWGYITAGGDYGDSCSFGIRTDGTLWAWGANTSFNFGQLGLGDIIDRSSPTQVGTNTNWTYVTNQNTVTLALTSSGQLWAWGYGHYGSLGLNDIIDRSSPVQVGADANWSKISVGYKASYGIRSNGTLWKIGGLGSSSPTQIGVDTNWSNLVSGGSVVDAYFEPTSQHNLAIKTDGSIWSWGSNLAGQLGLNNTTSQTTPVRIGALTGWSTISAGSEFSLAVRNGALLSWGSNGASPPQGVNFVNNGLLGYPTPFYTDTTTVVISTSISSPVQIGSTLQWAGLATGIDFSLAVRPNGTLWAWGNNTDGDLGLNNRINRSSPVQVGSLTDWYKIGSGGSHVFAIKTDGTLWAWGSNDNGELGINSSGISGNANRSSPVQVGSLTNWSNVNAGSANSNALKSDRTIWAWGRNSSGELGVGDTINRSSPTQIGTLTNWSKISIGVAHSLAIKTDGTLWTWGNGTVGALGLNSTISYSSPVQVGTLTNWSNVNAGNSLSMATKTDGTLWMWGYNVDGQLGLSNTITRSSPVQVGSLAGWDTINADVLWTFSAAGRT